MCDWPKRHSWRRSGLKVHINVVTFASGTRFGPFEEERGNIARIVDVAKAHNAPVGVVPGGSPFATEDDFEKLDNLALTSSTPTRPKRRRGR
jgi:hypothetical protein